MSSRRQAPIVESLESRELLMGFSMNPIRTPVMFDLRGTAAGTARAGLLGETVNAAGVITPAGPAQVTGTLSVVGKAEFGTLTVASKSSHLTLLVSGTAGKPLHFTTTGATTVPHTAFPYRVVDGSGTVTVRFSPGPKGPLVSLTFTG